MTKRCTKGAKEKKGPKRTGYSHCPTWKDVVDKILDEMRKLEEKAQKPKRQGEDGNGTEGWYLNLSRKEDGK